MKKESLLPLLLLATLASCNLPRMIQTTAPLYPTRPLHAQANDNILIANRYHVNAQDYRENKEKLFKNLLDGIVDDITYVLKENSSAQLTPIHGRLKLGNTPDSTIEGYMANYNASQAIIITYYNAYFDQTGVEVTKDENGKSKVASYEIVVDVSYDYWKNGELQFDSIITVRRYHSSRQVLSGLLAAGPNIVSNADDAHQATRANVDLFMRSFYERSENRIRPLFVKKEFEKVDAAIKAGDYERAFTESENKIASKRAEIKSKGYYNCAVLLERKGEYVKTRLYLEEALKLYELPEARNMMFEYRHQPR